MKQELRKLGVNFTISRGCSCQGGSVTYIYVIPVRIDESIEEIMEPLGKSSMSFKKQSMIKINNIDFSLIAVNRLKQIKLTIKNPTFGHIVEQFEELLIKYIKSK